MTPQSGCDAHELISPAFLVPEFLFQKVYVETGVDLHPALSASDVFGPLPASRAAYLLPSQPATGNGKRITRNKKRLHSESTGQRERGKEIKMFYSSHFSITTAGCLVLNPQCVATRHNSIRSVVLRTT